MPKIYQTDWRKKQRRTSAEAIKSIVQTNETAAAGAVGVPVAIVATLARAHHVCL